MTNQNMAKSQIGHDNAENDLTEKTSKVLCNHLNSREELISWEIKNFKPCSKFFGKKSNIKSEPFESAGCIWQLRLTASSLLGQRRSEISGKTYRQWYRPYFNSIYKQDPVDNASSDICNIDWFFCDLHLLHSYDDEVHAIFHAAVVGLENDSEEAPIYVPAVQNNVNARHNIRYTHCFKLKDDSNKQLHDLTQDSTENQNRSAKILKLNRDFMLNPDEEYFKNGSVKIQLHLSVLVESMPTLMSMLSTVKCCHSYSMFFQRGLFSDFTIVGKNGIEFNVHKVLLGNSSPYFMSMLTSNMKECKDDTIYLKDDDPKALHNLLHYIYNQDFGSMLDQSDKTEEDIVEEMLDLMIVSDKYQMTGLSDIIENQLASSMDFKKALLALPVADAHHHAKLRTQAKNQLVIAMPRILSHDNTENDVAAWLNFLADHTVLGWEIIKQFRKISDDAETRVPSTISYCYRK